MKPVSIIIVNPHFWTDTTTIISVLSVFVDFVLFSCARVLFSCARVLSAASSCNLRLISMSSLAFVSYRPCLDECSNYSASGNDKRLALALLDDIFQYKIFIGSIISSLLFTYVEAPKPKIVRALNRNRGCFLDAVFPYTYANTYVWKYMLTKIERS